MPASEREGARTVGRVLKLLELVASTRKHFRLVDISEALDIPASSAHVLVKQLMKYDYLRIDDSRRYTKSTALMMLASQIMSSNNLLSVARPFIEKLSEETSESVYLGMRTEAGIAYIDAIEGTSGLVSRTPIGSLRPTHASSAGRVFLAYAVPDSDFDAFLGKAPLHAYTPRTPTDRAQLRRLVEDIRKDGYSVNQQAFTDKVSGVSAPIFDAGMNLAGTITLSAPDSRFEMKKEWFTNRVMACAEKISQAMGRL